MGGNMKLNISFQMNLDDVFINNLINDELQKYVKTDEFKTQIQASMRHSISDIFEEKMFDDTIDKIQHGIIDPFVEKVIKQINSGLEEVK
jgi:hypothetical protein